MRQMPDEYSDETYQAWQRFAKAITRRDYLNGFEPRRNADLLVYGGVMGLARPMTQAQLNNWVAMKQQDIEFKRQQLVEMQNSQFSYTAGLMGIAGYGLRRLI